MNNLNGKISSNNGGTPTVLSMHEIRKLIAKEHKVLEPIITIEQPEIKKETKFLNNSVKHYKRPVEHLFTQSQREHTTVLFSGLTLKHEKLIIGALEGLGYNIQNLPVADVNAFQYGKEYGNNGQCNPTYFTVGNLVQYLLKLEEQGMSRQEIIDNYVYLTAGNSCGTCRFAMYEAEYRLALRNAGFEGFRVLTFELQGGLDQSTEGPGLDMNMDFFICILNGVIIGDLINDIAYQIRPYEVNPGETDRVLEECMDELYEVMKNSESFQFEGKINHYLQKFPPMFNKGKYIGEIITQIYGDYYTEALKRVGKRINRIEVDRTKVKPIVKIVGEFWAHITEGDGNFNMFRFLEREGAHVLIEPVTSFLLHILRQLKDDVIDRKGVDLQGKKDLKTFLIGKPKTELARYKKVALVNLAMKALNRKWNYLRDSFDNFPHKLVDQYELKVLGDPYYDSRARGGESHLEIAKNIYYHINNYCHMVLSLKPFGCMPSTQSDGVQTTVMNHYKNIIYLPIETSGEGEINAHSRVQMALGEAKIKAKEEFEKILDETGYTIEDIHRYMDTHPELKKPFYNVPHYKGVTGIAANFVKHVAERMN